MRKSIYYTSLQPHPLATGTHIHLLTTPTSHTHIFHPLSTIVICTLNFALEEKEEEETAAALAAAEEEEEEEEWVSIVNMCAFTTCGIFS